MIFDDSPDSRALARIAFRPQDITDKTFTGIAVRVRAEVEGPTWRPYMKHRRERAKEVADAAKLPASLRLELARLGVDIGPANLERVIRTLEWWASYSGQMVADTPAFVAALASLDAIGSEADAAE